MLVVKWRNTVGSRTPKISISGTEKNNSSAKLNIA